jgi:hypothetical protein
VALGPVDDAFLMAGFLLEAAVVVSSLYRREFQRYLNLNIYMILLGVADYALIVCAQQYGLNSRQYFVMYYSSDVLLGILMYALIIELYQHAFARMNFRQYIRLGAGMLLVLTALVSYVMVHNEHQGITTKFAVELEQNLNFVGVVLTYILAGSVLKMEEKPARLVQIVMALGVYFSATAGAYALRNLFPALGMSFVRWLPTCAALWLPLAWTYSFVHQTREESHTTRAENGVSARQPAHRLAVNPQ